jgi:mRNA degradation ribonuclease J1/J2
LVFEFGFFLLELIYIIILLLDLNLKIYEVKELTERELIIYENELIRVYSPNAHKAGSTMFVYLHKYSGQILLIDCGLGFNARQNKNDTVIPQLADYELEMMKIVKNLSKRKNPKPVDGLLTHGHFDHVAGVRMVSGEVEMMWHGTLTTQAMITRSKVYSKQQIKEDSKFKFNPLKTEYGTLYLGNFIIYYFPTVHSIPETLSFVIRTTDGFRGLHMAEFRTKESSLFPGLSDKMMRGIVAGTEGEEYDVVFIDTLRSEEGISKSGDIIEKPIRKILDSPDFPKEGALIMPFISSKIEQIGVIQKIANQCGCTMFPAGRAMSETTSYGRSRGWIEQQIKFENEKRLLIPCTGSQNEPGAALPRALEGSARDLCLVQTDWVFMIQCVIPHYKETAKQMYKNVLRRSNIFVAGVRDLSYLGFSPSDNKIKTVESLIGENFENSSGHGRKGDQDAVKAVAPCKNNRYIGYQCEEEPTTPEDGEAEITQTNKPISNKSELLTLVDNYINNLSQAKASNIKPKIY